MRCTFSIRFLVVLALSILDEGLSLLSKSARTVKNLSWTALELSRSKDDDNDNDISNINRRDLLWKVPLVSLGTFSYGKLVYNALSVQDISYPAEHESRTRRVISQALERSMAEKKSGSVTFRVLEVGIGKDCRVARRGLYDSALSQLNDKFNVPKVEIVGIDLVQPSADVLEKANSQLNSDTTRRNTMKVDLKAVKGSITQPTPFSSGYFDCVVCFLTLCSVDDPDASVLEMKRVLRPSGGTLGWVEHVAVDPSEPYRFLDWQQRKLDKVQQILADNCHLHRESAQTIARIMGCNDQRQEARVLSEERFLVDAMWPVSMQSCGVLQRQFS